MFYYYNLNELTNKPQLDLKCTANVIINFIRGRLNNKIYQRENPITII